MTTVTRQNSFAAGLWSPTLHERFDLKGYLNALGECRNFIVTKHGALTNRPGTRFVAEVKYSAKKVRLIPFNFGGAQSFVLEFGDQYVRFYQNGGTVLSGGVPYEIVSPYLEAELPLLKYAQSGDVITLVHPAHLPYELRRLGNTNWTLAQVSYDAAKAVHRSIKVESLTADTVNRQWAITALYADGSESLPRITASAAAKGINLSVDLSAWVGDPTPIGFNLYKGLARSFGLVNTFLTSSSSGTSLTVEDNDAPIDFDLQPPSDYHPFHDFPGAWAVDTIYHAGQRVVANGAVWEATNSGRSAVSGPGPSGAGIYVDGFGLRKNSTAYLINDRMVFLGLRWKCSAPGNTAASFVNAGFWGDPVVVDGTVTWARDTTGSPIDDQITWTYVGPAASAAPRYPSTACYHEQRQWYGGLTDAPADMIASMVGSYKNFDPPAVLLDDSPITGLNLAALTYEEIRWLLPARVLLAATNEAIWPITGAGGSTDAITAKSRKTRSEVFRGMAALSPLRVGEAVLAVADPPAVFGLEFDFRLDSYRGSEISLFADHLLEGVTIVDWAHAPLPFSVAWQVRSDGVLLGLTALAEQQISAWHWHDTQGLFENVCVVKEGTEYAVYVVVNRIGATKRYIERFVSRVLPRVNGAVDVKRGVFLDCALSYDAAPATVFSGLNHLEGQEVMALADGDMCGPYTVVAGQIDISTEKPDGASVIHVGLSYVPEGESLDFVMQGTDTGEKYKRVIHVGFRVVDTRGGEFGPSLDALVPWRQREVRDSYGAIPAFTGRKKILVPSKFDRNGRVAFRQPDPLPMTIVGLSREVELGD
jgi:hypothetical protein